MGQDHTTRTKFDQYSPSYDYGFRFVQGNLHGPGTGGSQFFSWYLGIGSPYVGTGGGGSTFGAMFAVDRGVDRPYLSVRYVYANSFTSWRKMASGYADVAGQVISPITSLNSPAFTNRSNGTRIVLLSAIDSTNVDYAIGVETDNMWLSVPSSSKMLQLVWRNYAVRKANRLTCFSHRTWQ